MTKKRKQSPQKCVNLRRSPRPNIGTIGAKLEHNAGEASLDAWRILYEHQAIDPEVCRTKTDFHWYPDAMTGLKKCHLRASFNISKDVAKKLLSEKVLSDSYERVQETFHHHVPPSKGHLFRLRNKDVN